MSIEELHIDFLSKFQRQGSYDFGAFTPDEIDWLLNEAQLTRIHQILKGDKEGTDFEETTTKYDVLENLIVRGSPIMAYVKTNASVEARLPGNYLEYIDSTSGYTCSKALEAGYIVNHKILIENKPYTKLEIYATTLNNRVPVKIYTLDDAVKIRDIITDTDAFFYLKRHILDTLNNYSIGVRADYAGNSFLHIESDSRRNDIRIVTLKFHDGEIHGQRDSPAYGKSNTWIYQEASTSYKPNKFIKHEEINTKLANPYSRPNSNNFLIEIAGGMMYVHHPAAIGVKAINLDYIRMPRMISHRTGKSIELGSTYGAKYHYGSQITDIAVQLAAMRIGSPNTEAAVHINSLTS